MHDEHSGGLPITRRALVAAATLGTASTAGCGGMTEQSFEATPVGLPDAARAELRLGERATDARTVSVDGPLVASAEITSHAATYHRDAVAGDT